MFRNRICWLFFSVNSLFELSSQSTKRVTVSHENEEVQTLQTKATQARRITIRERPCSATHRPAVSRFDPGVPPGVTPHTSQCVLEYNTTVHTDHAVKYTAHPTNTHHQVTKPIKKQSRHTAGRRRVSYLIASTSFRVTSDLHRHGTTVDHRSVPAFRLAVTPPESPRHSFHIRITAQPCTDCACGYSHASHEVV